MGACCDKEVGSGPSGQVDDIGLSAVSTLPPFCVFQSQEQVRYDPNAVFVGVYNIGNTVIYVFSSPKPNPGPNTLWIKNGVIEVLCEQSVVDIDIIMRQIEQFQKIGTNLNVDVQPVL